MREKEIERKRERKRKIERKSLRERNREWNNIIIIIIIICWYGHDKFLYSIVLFSASEFVRTFHTRFLTTK